MLEPEEAACKQGQVVACKPEPEVACRSEQVAVCRPGQEACKQAEVEEHMEVVNMIELQRQPELQSLVVQPRVEMVVLGKTEQLGWLVSVLGHCSCHRRRLS
jgi:hypothetical protein